ncbi:MAG TPA: hypothetical protein VML91_00585 [Burkholderiales bacterium]|nr:hypothetical protein [Burkholderiales bacterium]
MSSPSEGASGVSRAKLAVDGVAPLSGLRARAGVPLWHRFGRLVYRYDEHFCNFRGLCGATRRRSVPPGRPGVSPRPGGLVLPAALVDVAALVGGFAGILVS